MSTRPEPKPDACRFCRGLGGYESGSKGKGNYAKCLVCGGDGRKKEKT